MEPPVFSKIQRAKAIIKDGIELHRKECASCGNEFFATKTQTKCEDCRKRKTKKR
jgi:hypothetical protein